MACNDSGYSTFITSEISFEAVTSDKLLPSATSTPLERLLSKNTSTAISKKTILTQSKLTNSFKTANKNVATSKTNIILLLLENASFLMFHIFLYLSPKDIFQVSHVNQKFKNIVLSHHGLYNLKQLYIKNRHTKFLEYGKENILSKDITKPLAHEERSGCKKFAELQNILPESSKKCYDFNDPFYKEGQKLSKGELQQKCIKCKGPARVLFHEAMAECCQEKCGYKYCMHCLLPFHTRYSKCKLIKSPVKPHKSSMFSAQCKKRLRRL